MSKYNNDYYFLFRETDERIPLMTADEETVSRKYAYQAALVGEKPFVFHNGSIDWQKANKTKPLSVPPDVLFNGADVLVD
ncbi:hypothetical protein R0381_002672 [Jeongeupia wiesaeckerbachi]|uniref:hypothetical protein n=1 Tax=Jeongeupia wiesaeckerbachi TaxID=3051218 RepID=UPI003D80523F